MRLRGVPDIFDLIVKERESLRDILAWRGIGRRSRWNEYTKIELSLIKKFMEAKSSGRSPVAVEIDGFVSRVGGRRFILRPSLAVDYGVLCEAEGLRSMPSDYEFVHVKGNRTNVRKTSRQAYADRLVISDCQPITLPMQDLRPELSTKGAGEILMEGYVDPPEQLTRNLTLSLTSSPGELNRVGGLTAALMPVKEGFAHAHSALLDSMKRSIPPDLTADKRIRVQVEGAGEFDVSPFPWNIHNSSWEGWDASNDATVFSRHVAGQTMQETTIGFAAGAIAPRTLDEVWIRRSDFPTLVDQQVVGGGESKEFDLGLAKYLITAHINHPRVENSQTESFSRMIIRRLIKLRREYDPLGYGGLIDPDMETGSPRSVLAMARALARGDGSDKVSEDHVRNALAEFVNSREDLFEVWSEQGKDFGSHVAPRAMLRSLGKTAERLYTYLSRNPDSSRAEMREAMPRVQDRIFNHAIDEMHRLGLIYRLSLEEERYRVTYE